MSRGIVVGLVLVWAGCSGGATCPEDPTACRGRVQIRWPLLTGELEEYEFNETCMPVGADKVQLDLVGPTVKSEKYSCQDGQTLLIGLEVGDYTITGTLLDEDETGAMTPVTSGETSASFSFAEEDVTVDVVFPYQHFLGSYTGSYYFKTKWGGATACAAAVPPVEQVVVKVERDGVPLTGVTADGMPLDGSAFGRCKDMTESPYLANDVAWGPAEITVTGRSEDGSPIFEQTYPTFVGAGRANPEFQFDVAAL